MAKPKTEDLLRIYRKSLERYKAAGDAERVRVMELLIANMEKEQ